MKVLCLKNKQTYNVSGRQVTNTTTNSDITGTKMARRLRRFVSGSTEETLAKRFEKVAEKKKKS